MQTMRLLASASALAMALSGANAMAADAPAKVATPAPAVAEGQTTPKADNTAMNSRDKGGGTLTPQNQTNQVNDRDLLAAVRRAVAKDKSLSKSAHNVKIVATNGVVTLRGPVKSAEEKAQVEKLAQDVTGVASVENQLDVKVQ
jgi:osmotically-inducible protein OsmY